LISEKIFTGKSTQTFPSLVIGLNWQCIAWKSTIQLCIGSSKTWILAWRCMERNTQPSLQATITLQNVNAKCKIMILLWSDVNRHLISG
jgi:hypothetical protein